MSISASPTPGPSHRASHRPHEILAKTLYDYCQNTFDPDHAITQNDLVKSNIIPNGDLNVLVGAIQELVNQRLFKVHTTKDGAVVWKIVAHDAAGKYKGLDPDQAIVYQCIEVADRAGIWSKTIKMKTNLHTKRVEGALKFLINAQLIKQCKSVKFPSRVMYILFHLQPSEDVTGGAFFTDGILDAALVQQISFVLEMKVSMDSYFKEEGPVPTGAGKSKGKALNKAEAEAIRDAALQDDGGSSKRAKTSENHRGRSSRSPEMARSKNKVRYLPYPAGYTGYSNLPELTNYLNKSKMVNTVLPTSAVNQVLDVLAFDDKIVKLVRPDRETKQDSVVYKARRTPDIVMEKQGAQDERDGNGMTEIPCGRCPVFEICEEGGPVSASNCEYWSNWIEDMRF